MGHFLRFWFEWPSSGGWFRREVWAKIQQALLSRQFLKQVALGWGVQQSMRAQEHGGVRQQRHTPSQPKAVQEQSAQTQLVFLVGLCRLDPRAHLLQQSLGGQPRQRQQTRQALMIARRKSELARASTCFPALRAKGWFVRYAKPMLIVQRGIFQPTQRFALRTLRPVPGNIRRHQFRARAQPGNHRHVPAFSAKGLDLPSHVTHVRDHDLGPPRPTPLAIMQAGRQQAALENIGRRHPANQGQQQHRPRVLAPPQTQGVFFVAHEPAALTRFEGAKSHGRTTGGVSAGRFFLKPSHAASKSVASINATAWDQPAARSINGPLSASLIARKPPTPTRARNSASMRTSGTRCRWASRAKERQARCSGSRATNWLMERAGVKTVSKWVRHNWAALKYRCGPRVGRRFQCSLIKPSGTYASKRLNSLVVPVMGSLALIGAQPTLSNPGCLRKASHNKFHPHHAYNKHFTPKLVTPSN